MVLDVLHLLCPTAVIHAECFEAAVFGDLVEAGLREQKQCTAIDLCINNAMMCHKKEGSSD